MKKILALAAVAALTAGVSAYAANPFSDVSTDDWAYQAVVDLSEQGIVEGYPDGMFKGEKNMTRFELAQIVARLMAKEDQVNAEQQATIDKLAGEYADELANLGVRVSNLEKKVGNISWSGNARMRYQTKDNTHNANPAKAAESWNGRVRINVKGQVNEDTAVNGRFLANMNFKDGSDADVLMDRLYVDHKFSDLASAKLGRYEVDAGGYGAWLISATFQGAEADFNLSKDVALGVGYGRFSSHDIIGGADEHYDEAEFLYAQAKADLKVAKLGVDYFKVGGDDVVPLGSTNGKYEVIGANVVVPVKDFRVTGDYYVNTAVNGDPQVWAAGVGYGAMNYKKPGSWNLDLAYFDVEKGVAPSNLSGWQLENGSFLQKDGSFWFAMGDVVLQKNVSLHAEYGFAQDADDNNDSEDSWTVSLNYKF